MSIMDSLNFLFRPLPKAHDFVQVTLKSQLCITGFKFIIFKNGDTSISVMYPSDYLDYLNTLIQNIKNITLPTGSNLATNFPPVNFPLGYKPNIGGVNTTDMIDQFVHPFLELKAKYPGIAMHNIYYDSLSSLGCLYSLLPGLASLLVPVLLYRGIPSLYQSIRVYMNIGTQPIRQTRLQRLHSEYNNRNNTIINMIVEARTN